MKSARKAAGGVSPVFGDWPRRARSNLVACSPGKKGEGRNEENDNRHPILSFDAKKAEFLNKKIHRRPPCCARYVVCREKDIIQIRSMIPRAIFDQIGDGSIQRI